MSTNDKLVADVMELADEFSRASYYEVLDAKARTALESAIRAALAQAVKDAVGEPVAEVHEGLHNGTRWIKALRGVNITDLPLGPLYALKDTP